MTSPPGYAARGDRDLVGREAAPQFFREQVLLGESLFLPRAGNPLAPRLVELGIHTVELLLQLADLERVRLVLLAQLLTVLRQMETFAEEWSPEVG